jgi:hypothetical protein
VRETNAKAVGYWRNEGLQMRSKEQVRGAGGKGMRRFGKPIGARQFGTLIAMGNNKWCRRKNIKMW